MCPSLHPNLGRTITSLPEAQTVHFDGFGGTYTVTLRNKNI